MGRTQRLPERDKYICSREYMQDRLAVMMGGRAAEEAVFGTVTSGAENDLKRATQLARKMVLDWAMSERLGYVAFGGAQAHVFLGQEVAQRRQYSEATAREIDQQVAAILDEAYGRAKRILEKCRIEVDRVAEALQEREEIPGEEVARIVGDVEPPEPERVKTRIRRISQRLIPTQLGRPDPDNSANDADTVVQ